MLVYLYLHEIFSLASDNEIIKPSKKKPFYPINTDLRTYLDDHGREKKLMVNYYDLLRFTYSVPLKDRFGNDTMWESVSYDSRDWDFLKKSLLETYSLLKTEGDPTYLPQLNLSRVDFCRFGNSQPFRILIINKYNDNHDHYYVKVADASRIYGLELEHILSPNRITFFTSDQTLVEEHVIGIPGDIFIERYLNEPTVNKIRVAKEFVKFNERCFMRLLGDMRSYNFVVNIIPDMEDHQFRFRAIDFDQQSYEGRKNLYLPQFLKENNPFVKMVFENLHQDSIEQYQAEERTQMAFRLVSARYRIKTLLDIMGNDNISTKEKIASLSKELGNNFNLNSFQKCKTMGDIVKTNMKVMLKKSLRLLPKTKNRISD